MDSQRASTSHQRLPHWPPSDLTVSEISEFCSLATDFAFAHGLAYRPPIQDSATSVDTSCVIHAPFSLLPSPFPRKLFEEAQRLQPILNELYGKIAMDHEFLERVFVGLNVIKVDDFQARLWEVYTQVRQESLAQHLQLGLFRSDYLLHDASDHPASHEAPTSATSEAHELAFKQVEFNTISSSFGPLCTRVSQLHSYLSKATRGYYGRLPRLGWPREESIPKNDALRTLAAGLANAHKAYLEQANRTREGVDAAILFVIQPNERNVFDQRALEYELLEKHGIRSIRRTLVQLAAKGPGTSVRTQTAWLRSSASSELFIWLSENSTEFEEISVVYFRAGYGPTDYEGPGNERAWDMRLLLERSQAIKCPSVALQLAGAKKVQQVLAEEGVLERFLLQRDEAKGKELGTQSWTEADLRQLRQSWTELYPLDPASDLGKRAYELAMREPQRFVLKPQREGGGNNIYKEDIPPALREMERRDKAERKSERGDVTERQAYILMSLIQPPTGVGNLLVKAGAGAAGVDGGATLAADVVSELGVYGTCLFGMRTGEGGEPVREIVSNESGGHLLRTKGRDSNEGGVAVGFSVIDSPFLV